MNKVQALSNLLFTVKKSNPTGLLFLYQKYGFGDPSTDLYPEITFANGVKKYGKPFTTDYVQVIQNKSIAYFDISMEDVNETAETLNGLGEWITVITGGIDGAITTDEEKAAAVTTAETTAQKEQDEAEKTTQYLYTAIGVVVAVILIIIALKFLKK